jgi:diguanylate cyclase (GGDEF)-like protein
VAELRATQRATCEDALTGLGNRRYFDLRLREELSRTRRNPIFAGGLVLVTADDLAAINRRHGRAVGDRALRWLARALRGALRITDVVCRMDGAELAAILCDTDACGVQEVVLRLRAGLAAGGPGRRWSPLAVTVAGASWPLDAQAPGALLDLGRARQGEERARRRGPAQQQPRLFLIR